MLAGHSLLIFMLYLVVSQLIAPFSVYAVEIVGLSETQLGYLYTLNGLIVVFLQVPVTRLIGHYRLSSQIAIGALLYAIGYGMVGAMASFGYFAMAIVVVTLGEIAMSPASLTLTSRLAPKGRTGRYMGIFGFFVASGWSFGPLYGGSVMEMCGANHLMAWALISTLALASAVGYWVLSRKLDPDQNAGR
jgi:MFS family permease